MFDLLKRWRKREKKTAGVHPKDLAVVETILAETVKLLLRARTWRGCRSSQGRSPATIEQKRQKRARTITRLNP